ncbi:MAG: hypothetical protein Q8L14_07070 [Myxococcales bacterium]|nr:hypothetical protein [Myxococcales bacterium]
MDRRMSRAGWWVFALIACTPVVPEPIEDAGVDACEIDGGVCPSAARARCRVDRLQATAAACRSSDDCTLFRFPPNCLDDGRCPGVAVSFSGEARFSVDATRELSAFCAATTCRPKLPCTETRTPRAECVSARCVLVFPDAGAADAGARDGGP